jgi:hypothetical protein
MVCLGALAGAFGTVAWLSVLCVPSFPRVMLGIFALGVAPVAGGGALLWAGLSMIETESARSRVRALSDARFIDAARSGATAAAVATRLGIEDAVEVERRLDELVARDALALEISEEGEVVYRGHGAQPGSAGRSPIVD